MTFNPRSSLGSIKFCFASVFARDAKYFVAKSREIHTKSIPYFLTKYRALEKTGSREAGMLLFE